MSGRRLGAGSAAGSGRPNVSRTAAGMACRVLVLTLEVTLLAKHHFVAAPDAHQTGRLERDPRRDRNDTPDLGPLLIELYMRGETLPDFVQTAVKEIDDQLRVLKDEASRLEAARAALTGGARRVGRPARNGTVQATPRPAGRRNDSAAAPRQPRGGSTRANQALALVREQPGITIPEIAQAMKIQTNYLYRVLPRLASDGQVTRDGQGWHPASSSTSTRAEPVRHARGRKQTRAAKPKPTASATRAASPRRSGESTSATNGRTARGATKASVLAALAGGDAMTASQVATKAGLARPTVSTTLSKLAKTGEVQKAERGYRLTSAA
jgi:DNA-binding IscR family transcriptional regulator